jgi:hypothetical protein
VIVCIPVDASALYVYMAFIGDYGVFGIPIQLFFPCLQDQRLEVKLELLEVDLAKISEVNIKVWMKRWISKDRVGISLAEMSQIYTI